MEDNKKVYKEFIDSFELNSHDTLFISSDISNLAKSFKKKGIAFNVNSFIEVLQEKLNEGCIIIPGYTDNLRNGQLFDHKKSKPTTGALSNKVGRRSDFKRTFDPLHSVYIWGKYSNDTASFSGENSFGKESIFGHLAKVNAKFIFIDVDLQNSFTFIHYLEQKNEVAYRKFYSLEMKMNSENRVTSKKIQFHTKRMGISTDLFPLQSYLLKNGYLQEKTIFQTRIFVSNASEMTIGVENCVKEGIKFYTIDLILFMKQFIKKLLGKTYF